MDDTVIPALLRYLTAIESHISHWCSLVTRYSLMALANFIMGGLDPGQVGVRAKEALALFDRAGGLSGFTMEALGWILISLSKGLTSGKFPEKSAEFSKVCDVIWTHLKNKVNETAETANFISGYGDDGVYVMLHSDRR